MSGRLRRLGVAALFLALLPGYLLPFGPNQAIFDPDGACGTVVIPEHAIQHFEAPLPRTAPDHCLLCHVWNAMASARTSHAPDVTPPANRPSTHFPVESGRLAAASSSHSSPRAPPTSVAL